MKKKNLLLMLFFALVLILAACSGNDDNNQKDNDVDNINKNNDEVEEDVEEGSDGEQVTLRMTWWGSQSRHDQTQEIIDLFEAENPDIKINSEFTGFDGYFEKMAAAAAGNNLPDIMQQNFGEYLNQYADKGLLADLTPFIDEGSINLDGVSDIVIESGTQGGKVLGIPTGTNALTVIYNKTLLDEAGVAVPELGWTWDDHEKIAQNVHDATGEYGTRHLDANLIFEYYLRERGFKLFNEDGTALGYDDDQILTDYFAMGKKHIDEGLSPGPDVIQQIQGIEDELVVHGKSPFDFRWSNQLGALAGAAEGQELGMTILPGDDITNGMYLKPAMLWSISETSEHKEEAARFIDFFTSTLEVYEIGGADRGVPIKAEIRDDLSSDLNENDQKVYDYINLVTENSSPIDSNFPPESSEILAKLKEIDELVMYGEISPEEGATQFREEVESILGR